VGIQAAPAVQAMPEGTEGGVMDHPPLDADAVGGLCGRCWGQVLAIDQRLASARHDQQEHGPVQAITGADLAEGSAGGVSLGFLLHLIPL